MRTGSFDLESQGWLVSHQRYKSHNRYVIAIAVEQLRQLLTYADIVASMSIDATESSLTPFDMRAYITLVRTKGKHS